MSEEKQGRAFPVVPVLLPRPVLSSQIPGSISVTGTTAPKQALAGEAQHFALFQTLSGLPLCEPNGLAREIAHVQDATVGSWCGILGLRLRQDAVSEILAQAAWGIHIDLTAP